MTADQIKSRLLDLLAEINKASGEVGNELHFHQQQKVEGHISVKKDKGLGRIYVQPSSYGCDISLSGVVLEKEMYPFMKGLFGKGCDGYKQRNRNKGWERQPFWRTDDFSKVRAAIKYYVTSDSDNRVVCERLAGNQAKQPRDNGNVYVGSIIDAQKSIIKSHNLYDWLSDYPWLTGYIGDIYAPIWFVAENPSLNQVLKQSKKQVLDNNLQWNASPGDQLLREAITEAGLKTGEVSEDKGWKCYITNVIKEPDIVGERNAKKRDSKFWMIQADIWQPVLQLQIDEGCPEIIVLLGRQAEDIYRHMVKNGLKGPKTIKIDHYSYIMLRPEAGTRRGPRHPERIREFKQSMANISTKFGM